MDEKEKEDRMTSLAYKLGQAFSLTVMLCVIALTIGVTVKLLTMIF